MGRVTGEQLERARLIPILEYILDYESDAYKRVGNGYRLKSDSAFAVDENGWYCHKRSIGSRTALDYLVEIKGYGLVEAVCTLLNESPLERSNRTESTTPSSNTRKNLKSQPSTTNTSLTSTPHITNPIPFSLPLRHKDNNRIIAYLQSRGIDRDLIMDCIERGVLFESKYYHNCVFLGKDEKNRTKFAAMRSITTNFMRDTDGSDKRYGFILAPTDPDSQSVAVYESPIDCLSHQTLCKQGYIPHFYGWRLSLGGTSLLALEHFLERYPSVKHCLICTDADKAGDKVATKISELTKITTDRSPPTHGTDWNDTLISTKDSKHKQNRTCEVSQLL